MIKKDGRESYLSKVINWKNVGRRKDCVLFFPLYEYIPLSSYKDMKQKCYWKVGKVKQKKNTSLKRTVMFLGSQLCTLNMETKNVNCGLYHTIGGEQDSY